MLLFGQSVTQNFEKSWDLTEKVTALVGTYSEPLRFSFSSNIKG
jgi:hypothetical protein